MSESIPEKAQILVVGGGPSGSYAAAVLAREGYNVVVLESACHPRYHIGESLLPSMIPYLKFAGVYEAINDIGFTVKIGAVAKFIRNQDSAFTNFGSHTSYNVERAEFDQVIFRHAGKMGAKTFENVSVNALEFADGTPNSRPISANYKLKTADGPVAGKISFDYLIDASGRTGLMSVKYLKNRHMKASLKNIAVWGYYKNAAVYGVGTNRENAPFFEALSDGSGWSWMIPLRGKVSVGVVLAEVINTERRKAAGSSEAHFEELVKLAPEMSGYLASASRIPTEPIRQASDYSYSCPTAGGEGFRIVGDAANFIDPLFSSGVHLAFVSALSAAVTTAASIRGEASEKEASEYHSRKCMIAYTRFLVVVLGIYKHIRNTELADDDLESIVSLQGVFDVIRPVIQGHADARSGDVGAAALETTSAETLKKSIQFCSDAYATSFEMKDGQSKYSHVMQAGAKTNEASDKTAAHLKTLGALSDEEIQAISALKEMQEDYINEEINGFTPRLEEKNLGLSQTAAMAS